MRTQRWQLATAIGLGLLGAIVFPTAAPAQVVADPSIGTIVTPNGTLFQITGGIIAGNRNLFHSFSRFDVPTGGVANFLNSPNIVNIFSRVTGGTASQIDGIVRSAGTANLFLMNPGGIIFGRNAQLDVGGSFVATTANAIQFGDRGFFSASVSEPPSQLLTIDPSALLFNQIPTGQIINNSIAPTGATSPLGSPVSGLRVPDGQSLLLVGGDINMDGGRLNALGGRIELGGLAGVGAIGLDITGDVFRLNFPLGSSLSNINLANDARVSVRGEGRGDIFVNANAFTATNGGRLVAGVDGVGNGGDITVNSNEFNISGVGASGFGSGLAMQVVDKASGNAGNIFVNTRSFKASSGAYLINDVLFGATGNAGDITIKADSISFSNKAQIDSSTYSQGNAGNLFITADNSIFLSDSSITTGINDNSSGNAGSITIRSGSLSADRVTLDSSNMGGTGNAGSISVESNGSVSFIDSSLLSNMAIATRGNAGSITIEAGSFLSKGSELDASTQADASQGNGNAGRVSILINGNAIFMSGTPETAIDFDDNPYTYVPGSSIRTGVNFGSAGKGGDILIQAGSLSLIDTEITSQTSTGGTSGNITLRISGDVSLVQTEISSGNINGEPGGGSLAGNIDARAAALSLFDQSEIQASSVGRRDGVESFAGNVSVQVDSSTFLSNSKILSQNFAQDSFSIGGRISLKSNSILLTDASEISTSTLGTGDAGNLLIESATATLTNGSVISSAVQSGAKGNGGSVQVLTKELNLSSGGQLNAAVLGYDEFSSGGQGRGGNIQVVAESVYLTGFSPDRVFQTINAPLSPPGTSSGIYTSTGKGATGQGGNITVKTGAFRVADGGVVSAQTLNPSNGGNITITANTFDAVNGGQVLTTTFNNGKAGNIDVSASDRINILGSDPGYTARSNQFGGNILANVSPASGVFANTSAESSGNGGSLSLTTTKLNLSDGGQISSQSQGRGGAGSITANAKSIRLRGNSDILTISNSGDGGNIILNAQTIVALENSDILAFAPAGKGGTITFNTRAFLSDPLYRLSPSITDRAALFALLSNDRVDVNASGTVSGTVNGVPDITFLQNGLTQLSQNLIDPNTLLANSCIVRNRQQNGRFYITGSGGLPVRPGDAPLSSFPTGDVRSLPEAGDKEQGTGSRRSWKIGDPIVEPQGIYRLSNGKLVLSRECEQ